MKQTILVVEDDKMIRQLVSIYLKKSGYDVVEAADGEAAKRVFLTEHPCLIILDLMLPKLSGEEFCVWVREQERNEVSIIMLSAKAGTDDKINGLKIGADDYLVKPFEPEELIAHVEAVLRRTGQFCQKITYDGLCIKPRKGEVLLFDQQLALTKHEFNLLYYFMENPNVVVSREALIDQLYPYADKVILDRTIDAHIKKLRRKIEDNPASPKRIKTVREWGINLLRKNSSQSLLPKRFLLRLTLINIIVTATFIVITSWAIYNTACVLADGLVMENNQRQVQFESTLFQYLWIFSMSAIIIGSLIHFYVTKKMMNPLRELVKSTKKMKQGQYPTPIKVDSEDEIGELIIHFNDLVKQLKDNEQHKKKLVSDLSHEFRTPLSNINGYLKALKNGVIEPDQKLYQSLYEESKRLTKLVEQMEQLKEWDYVSKQTFSEKTSVNINLLVDQSVDMFRWALKNTGIHIDVQVESGIVSVYNGGIPQVISNLIENAIRYYHGTGPIKIKGEKLEKEYILSVTGPGEMVPKEEQEKIFERFYRIDPSRASESGGTGLGLAISKEIIEHHNGRIGLKSDGNQHTFWFTLPLD